MRGCRLGLLGVVVGGLGCTTTSATSGPKTPSRPVLSASSASSVSSASEGAPSDALALWARACQAGARQPCAPSTYEAWVARVDASIARARATPPGDGTARADAILRALHGDVLRSYEAGASRLQDVFERGRFNCVSAAIVFNLAAARAGLPVAAELLPTHARSLLGPVAGAFVPVEATAPAGVAPSAKLEAEVRARFGGPGGAEGRAIRISTRTLVAVIRINAAAALNASGRSAAATVELDAALADIESAPLRESVMTHIGVLRTHQATEDARAGRLDAAVRGLRVVLEGPWAGPALRPVATHNLLAAQQRRYQAASAHGARALAAMIADVKRWPSSPVRQRALAEGHRWWAEALIGEKRYAEALQALRSAPVGAEDLPGLETRIRAVRRAGAEALAAAGRLDEALGWTSPDAPERLFLLAAQNALRRKAFWPAFEILVRGWRRHPGRPALRQNLAYTVGRLARDPRACARLRAHLSAVGLSSDFPEQGSACPSGDDVGGPVSTE